MRHWLGLMLLAPAVGSANPAAAQTFPQLISTRYSNRTQLTAEFAVPQRTRQRG